MWGSYWHRRWPNPDFLSRFAGYEPPCTPVDIMTLPSGYTQLNNGQYAPSPLLVNQDPSVGAFIRSSEISFEIIDAPPEYIPPNLPDARFGTFAFGVTPFGWIRSYHGTIIEVSNGPFGFGYFAFGVSGFGIMPIVTETEIPWPALGQVGATSAIVQVGSGSTSIAWNGYSITVRAVSSILPTGISLGVSTQEFSLGSGYFMEATYLGPWPLSTPIGTPGTTEPLIPMGVEVNWGAIPVQPPRGS